MLNDNFIHSDLCISLLCLVAFRQFPVAQQYMIRPSAFDILKFCCWLVMAVIIIFSTVVVQDEGHDFIEVIIGIVQKEKKKTVLILYSPQSENKRKQKKRGM